MTDRAIEFKKVPQFIKGIDGRKVDGIFSVAGVLDSYRDIVNLGAFAKTFQERGGKILHLWQHDFYSPPTAVVQSLAEVERDDLPELLRAKHPEATGGALVTREYLDTPRGNEVLAAIKGGSPLQMSFGYDVIRYEEGELEDGGYVRYLNEIRLWETSDVLWGANRATQASKERPSIPLATVLGQLDDYLSALKAGRAELKAEAETLNRIAHVAYELGATAVKVEAEFSAEVQEAVFAPLVQGLSLHSGTAVSDTGGEFAWTFDNGAVTLSPIKTGETVTTSVVILKADGAENEIVGELEETEVIDAVDAGPETEAEPEPEAEPDNAPEAETEPEAEPDGDDEPDDELEVDSDEGAKQDESRAGANEQPLTLAGLRLRMLELEN